MSNGRKPFLLGAIGKDYLWGGSRLNDDFGLGLACSPLAEAWVCSAHPDGSSSVEDTSLDKLLTPDLLGSHASRAAGGELPILIKLIDAKEKLSVQVHPDDEYAKSEGQLGKTELWYVLDARPDAELICGFNRDVCKEQVRNAIASGTIEALLNHVPVHKGDLFLIEPGTVHAIGAGVLLAEIQENSNLTYRLYDYDRVDKDGKKRELHVDKALELMKMTSSASPRQPMRVLRYKAGCASELLTRCRYFQVERLLLNTEGRTMPEIMADENSFRVLLCTSGCGVLYGTDVMIPFFKGDCIFVPAGSIPLRLHGRAELLNVSC